MLAIVLVAAYLLGSIPSGLIFGRLIWHKDLRRYGSKNLGATNAWRVLGKPAGLLIFALDFLKGVLSVLLAQIFIGTAPAMVLAGLLAIVGHSCSIFLKFRGGKGVAIGLGVIAFLMPSVTSIVFMVWLVIVLLTRYVSLGSIVAAILVPILALIFKYDSAYVIFGVIAAIFITIRHKENIVRLIHGRENKI